jgi:uncharacterized repeat protein (TIGR02543 family)
MFDFLLKPARGVLFTLLIAASALFVSACSSDVNSSDRQNPDGRPTFFVTLDTQGAQEWDPITVFEGDNLEGRLQTPTKQGFLFEGWSSSGDDYEPYTLDTPVTANLTLYAKWDGQTIVPEDTYRLTVHLMGGAFLNVPQQEIPINHKGNKTLQQLPRMNQHPNPPPEFSVDPNRKVFSVWNTEPDGSGEYIFPNTLITGDLDIYALYAKPLATTDDVRNIVCNSSDAWYAFETTLIADPLRDPLCQDPNAPFRGKILPGFPVSTSPPYQSCLGVVMSAPRTHGGLFAYTDGADIVSLYVCADIQNVSYAVGGLAAEAKNTRLISNRVGPVGYNDLGGRSALVKSDGYTGGIVGIGDNLTISSSAYVELSGKNYVGGIAGKLTNSKLSGGFETMSITLSADGGYGGGVVGYMENGTITSSYYAVQELSFETRQKLTSTYPNVSMGTLAGYLKNVDVSRINTRERCPLVLAQRENSVVGMVGTLDGGSIKGAWTCGIAAVYGVNSIAGGIVGKMLNNASVEDVVASGQIRGIDPLGVLPAGSHAGGIVGDAAGGRVKGALALNSLIAGETTNPIIVANSGTNISNSYFIIGIRKSPNSNSSYTGGVSRYDIYDKKEFFNDTLGWDFENSSVWEMREYDELPLPKGSGTDYIPITNAEELYNIGYNGATLARNYVLMNDIDLSELNSGIWIPIGTQAPGYYNYFTGTLHGNNKKIRNFRMDNSREQLGLFLSVNSANIRHLIIEDFHFTYVTGGIAISDAAPIISYMQGPLTIRNVHTSGTFDYASDADRGFRYVAGIVANASSTTTISDSSFTGTIKLKGSYPLRAAGILTGTGTVSTSKTSGRIEIQNAYTSPITVAGIAHQGTVQSSYSDMDIIVRHTGAAATSNRTQVGGILTTIASNAVDVRYNYFAGSIDLGSDYTYNSAGGIAGAVTGQTQVLKSNLVLTDRITVDDPARNVYGRIIGSIYNNATYPERTTVAIENYALPTLANGTDRSTAPIAIVANGSDLTAPVDNIFLESLYWDMSLWKPVTPGTLPKLAWEE